VGDYPSADALAAEEPELAHERPVIAILVPLVLEAEHVAHRGIRDQRQQVPRRAVEDQWVRRFQPDDVLHGPPRAEKHLELVGDCGDCQRELQARGLTVQVPDSDAAARGQVLAGQVGKPVLH